jgi:probable F420-dependent oxidoreductase
MKIGFFAIGIGPLTDPRPLQTIASHAERLAFASLWAPEHVVLLDRYASRYPYSTGEFPAPTDSPIGDPFTTLAFAAACTKTIRLATGISLVPEHNPLVLAKTIATTDRLSSGRVVLGVGIGWLREEFEAIGVPWEERAERTREYVEVLRKLWSEERSSHDGKYVKFSGVRSFPKPANGKSVPVWFGGESGPALKRVAGYGDGWIGFNLTADEAEAKIRRIEDLLRANGRKRSEVELAVCPYTNPIGADDLRRYRDAGVEEVALFALDMPPSERDIVARLERMAREYIEPAAKL